MKASGVGSIVKWDENVFNELSDAMIISKADIEYSFSGDIDGKAIVQYIMFYSDYNEDARHESTAKYVGMIQFSGKLADKSGSFVLEDNGTFKGGAVNSEIKIIKNSGTGDLKNIQGSGIYAADQDGFRLELDYSL